MTEHLRRFIEHYNCVPMPFHWNFTTKDLVEKMKRWPDPPLISKSDHYLFADGHVKALKITQTLSPVVLWDNVNRWCAEAKIYGYGWGPKDVEGILKNLKREGIE
jgi:hypothetical protein